MLLGVMLASCSKPQSGPPTVTETSAARADLTDRVRFVEKYVTFRRNYKDLEYNVTYQNNGGGIIPGPSDWDIRLIAEVPSADLDDWIPSDTEKGDGPSPPWLGDLPGAIAREGIAEWYRKAAIEVGIDRARSIVAYRNTSTPD